MIHVNCYNRNQQDIFLNKGAIHLRVLVVTANNYQSCGVISMFSSCAVKTSLILALTSSWHMVPPPHSVWKHNLLATVGWVEVLQRLLHRRCVFADSGVFSMEANALHDFTATSEDELSFRKGSIIKVRYNLIWLKMLFDLFNFLWPCCVHVGYLSHPPTRIVVDYLSTNMLGWFWSR